MDIANVVKLFSNVQRELFVCFIILLPCYFTLLLFYVPLFLTYELYYQVIISIAATVMAMSASYSFICVSNIIAKTNVYNPVTILFVNYVVLSYIFYNNNTSITKEYFINTFIIFNGVAALAFSAIFYIDKFLKKCEKEGN